MARAWQCDPRAASSLSLPESQARSSPSRSGILSGPGRARASSPIPHLLAQQGPGTSGAAWAHTRGQARQTRACTREHSGRCAHGPQRARAGPDAPPSPACTPATQHQRAARPSRRRPGRITQLRARNACTHREPSAPLPPYTSTRRASPAAAAIPLLPPGSPKAQRPEPERSAGCRPAPPTGPAPAPPTGQEGSRGRQPCAGPAAAA